jgi:hypothetical protein
LYVTVKGEKNQDFKILQKCAKNYEITALPDGKPHTVSITDLDI